MYEVSKKLGGPFEKDAEMYGTFIKEIKSVYEERKNDSDKN